MSTLTSTAVIAIRLASMSEDRSSEIHHLRFLTHVPMLRLVNIELHLIQIQTNELPRTRMKIFLGALSIEFCSQRFVVDSPRGRKA